MTDTSTADAAPAEIVEAQDDNGEGPACAAKADTGLDVETLAIARNLQRQIDELDGRIARTADVLKGLKAEREKAVQELLETLPEPAGDDDWRAVLLADIRQIEEPDLPALPERMVGAMGDEGIHTLGDLADREQDVGFELTDLNGIGPKAAEDIKAALVDYWQQHPRPEGTVPRAAAAKNT